MKKELKNWVPSAFQNAASDLAKDAVKRFVNQKDIKVIGLGSGPMAAEIVKQMNNHANDEKMIEYIATSFQIKLEAENIGLKVVDEGRIPEIDVVFDGADEIDSNYNMIKGGGGALLKEKIVHSATKKIVIAAE